MTPGAQILITSGPYAGRLGVIDCNVLGVLGVTLRAQPGQARERVEVLAGDVERVA